MFKLAVALFFGATSALKPSTPRREHIHGQRFSSKGLEQIEMPPEEFSRILQVIVIFITLKINSI